MITVQKNEIPQFQWITKSKMYSRVDADVSITIGTKNRKTARCCLIFRNFKHKHFKSGYIMFGIDGDRLYFAESDSFTGYKLSEGHNSASKYCSCTDSALVEWARTHIGDYRLDQDSKSGLYYVNAERLGV